MREITRKKSVRTKKNLPHLDYRRGKFSYLTVAPNGISANLANLKCCNPNGIPMMVIHNVHPSMICSNANGNPDTRSHSTFRIKDDAPPP